MASSVLGPTGAELAVLASACRCSLRVTTTPWFAIAGVVVVAAGAVIAGRRARVLARRRHDSPAAGDSGGGEGEEEPVDQPQG